MSQTKKALFILFVLLFPSLAFAADYTYEIYDPYSAPSSPNLQFTASNVILKAESDFRYWHPNSSSSPGQLVFKFTFDKPIASAYAGIRADNFNQGYDTYTKIEASKNGTDWTILKETYQPDDYLGWNNGSWSGNLESGLLGAQEIHFRITLQCSKNGTLYTTYRAQALRHQPSVGNRTFLLEVDYENETQAATASLTPILNLLLSDSSLLVAERTDPIDPVAIGGEGTKIIYEGQTYTGTTTIRPGSLVGIEKDGQYYLYHPQMGTNVTFSEESNKRAALYAMLDPDGTATKSTTTKTTSTVYLDGVKIMDMPTGLIANTSGHTGNIKFENTLNRWVALKVHKPGTTEIVYLSPASATLPDPAQLMNNVIKSTTSWTWDGSTAFVNALDATKIEVFCAIGKAFPFYIASAQGYPANTSRARTSDSTLLSTVTTLDYCYTFYTQVCNIIKAGIPLECCDAMFDIFATQISTNMLNIVTYDERLEEAIAQEGLTSAAAQAITCGGVVASGGVLEIFFSFWDLAKALCDIVEAVPAAMLEQTAFDAYSEISITDADRLTIISPPDKTTYSAGETLDLTGSEVALHFDDISTQRIFEHGLSGYVDLGITTTPTENTTLNTSHTSFDFFVPAWDMRYLDYDNEYKLTLGRINNPLLKVTQPITVTGIAIPCGNGGGKVDQVTFDHFTIHFGKTYRICTDEIVHSSGNTVHMLYFYMDDGSGTYQVPYLGTYEDNYASLSYALSYADLQTVASPLLEDNTYAEPNFDPETSFKFQVVNRQTELETYGGDYLLLKVKAFVGGSWHYVYVNPEWVYSDGTYTGNN